MKFFFLWVVLFRPLQVVSGVVECCLSLPIFFNVLVNVSANGLAVTATDLEVEIVVVAPLDSPEGGQTTFPARKFIDICRALPEDALLEIAVDKDKAVLRSGKSRFVLATLPATEFPSIE